MKYILAVLQADVVGLGHVHHEVGGRAEPVAAGEEQLSARGQVVGAHVPRVRRQGQGVAVHAHSRGVRGQDYAAAAAGADRPVSERDVRGAQEAATTLSAPPSSGKRTAICRAEAASVTPSLLANKPSTCVMV